MKQAVLHPENLLRVPLFGKELVRRIERHSAFIADKAARRKDPGISVVIRSRNNAEQLAGLFEDMAAQNFSGEVEVIVVDTESTDGTVEIAKRYGAKVIPILQKDFSYPKALNLGFEAATSTWIFSLVDHSALSHRNTFRIATAYNADSNVGGVWCIPLPNKNATIVERLAYVLVTNVLYRKVAIRIVAGKDVGGIMGANSALYRRDVWERLGKFDLSYGAGGEDAALGRAMVAAGYGVHYDQAMSVYHTHGLNAFQSLMQVRYWRSLNRPHPFDSQKLKEFRGKLFN